MQGRACMNGCWRKLMTWVFVIMNWKGMSSNDKQRFKRTS